MKITILCKNKCYFGDPQTCPLKILREMFACNHCRPIMNMESEIINTNEYNHHLRDYEDLTYDEKLCCRECKDRKRANENSYVIYADFESDVTVNPHRAYLCCAVWEEDEDVLMKRVFKGFNYGKNYVEWCTRDSLVFFPNLKYDASFFMNVKPNDYYVKVIERNSLTSYLYEIKRWKDNYL